MTTFRGPLAKQGVSMKIADVSQIEGPLAELRQQLSGDNGAKRFEEFKLWLKKVSSSPLNFVRSRVVMVRGDKTSQEYFHKAGIVSMSDRFLLQFLGQGSFSHRSYQQVLSIHTHIGQHNASSFAILEELGTKAVVSIHAFTSFLGENRGTNGTFLSYVEGESGELSAVHATWFEKEPGHPAGWHVYSIPLTQDLLSFELFVVSRG